MRKLIVLMLFLQGCNSTYVEHADESTIVDTSRVLYKNSFMVVEKKAGSDQVPDVYLKFRPYNTFEDFKVDTYYTGEKAILQLEKDSDFWLFRTRIKKGYNNDVSFAGKYCFVVWGCGASCQMGALIDASTGLIYNIPSAVQGYEYKIDSRMLIVNPPQEEVLFDDNTHEKSKAIWANCDYCTPQIFIWQEDIKEFVEKK